MQIYFLKNIYSNNDFYSACFRIKCKEMYFLVNFGAKFLREIYKKIRIS